MIVWGDGVVPFAVELGTFEGDGGYVCVRYDNAAGVLAGVEFTAHSEAGFGGSGRNQLDDQPIADERLGAPVLADEGEEAVFDFVPLAGAGRQVADRDIEAEFVGQLLEFAFPQPHPRTVAAPAPSLRWGRLGGDQQSGCLGIARPTDGAPPLADAIDGERGRVMVNADTHPTRIGGEVVDPVRHRAAEFLDQEVMDPDLFRVAVGAIFAPVVAEIPTGQARGLKAHEMRAADPPMHYLVGTPKGRLTRLEKHLVARPWQEARPGVQVKLLAQEGELYVLAQSRDRVAKERAMRRRQLKRLWARLKQLSTMQLTREELLMKLGAA